MFTSSSVPSVFPEGVDVATDSLLELAGEVVVSVNFPDEVVVAAAFADGVVLPLDFPEEVVVAEFGVAEPGVIAVLAGNGFLDVGCEFVIAAGFESSNAFLDVGFEFVVAAGFESGEVFNATGVSNFLSRSNTLSLGPSLLTGTEADELRMVLESSEDDGWEFCLASPRKVMECVGKPPFLGGWLLGLLSSDGPSSNNLRLVSPKPSSVISIDSSLIFHKLPSTQFLYLLDIAL